MIVATISGVGPDGLPFEASTDLGSRYSASHSDWLAQLVESGGATDDGATTAPALPGGPPQRHVSKRTATLQREQGVVS